MPNAACSASAGLTSASVTLNPDPAQIGSNVNLSIAAVFDKDHTVTNIKLYLGILPVGDINLDSPKNCKKGAECDLDIVYSVSSILGPGTYNIKAVPSGYGSAVCPIQIVSSSLELEDSPSLSRCSGSPTTCTLESDTFNPYPIKKGSSETVSMTVNCNKALTVKNIDIKALGATVISLGENVNCSANTDCELTASADVPSIPFISSINAQAVAYDSTGAEIACYEGKMKLKFSEEDFY